MPDILCVCVKGARESGESLQIVMQARLLWKGIVEGGAHMRRILDDSTVGSLRARNAH